MKLLSAIAGALILTLSPLTKAQEESVIPLPEISVYINPQIKLFYILWWSAGKEWNYDVEVMTNEFSPSWWRPMVTLDGPRGHWFIAYTYYDTAPLGIARVAVSRKLVKTTQAQGNADAFGKMKRAKRVDIRRLGWVTIVRY